MPTIPVLRRTNWSSLKASMNYIGYSISKISKSINKYLELETIVLQSACQACTKL